VDVRLHRHLLIYPSTTDFHRFLINGRRGKTSTLAVLERFVLERFWFEGKS